MYIFLILFTIIFIITMVTLDYLKWKDYDKIINILSKKKNIYSKEPAYNRRPIYTPKNKKTSKDKNLDIFLSTVKDLSNSADAKDRLYLLDKLIKEGKYVFVKDENGNNAMAIFMLNAGFRIKEYSNIPLFEYLLNILGKAIYDENNEAKVPIFHIFKYKIDKIITDSLIKKKLLKKISNHKSSKGITPLMISSIYNECDNIKLLIKQGIDINQKDNNGLTALSYAVTYSKKHEWHDWGGNIIGYSSIDTIKLLLKKGADINVKTVNGKSMLEIASNDIHLDFMYDYFDRSIIDNNRKIILIRAAERGWSHIIQDFYDKGFKIDDIYNEDNENLLLVLIKGSINEAFYILFDEIESLINIFIKMGLNLNNLKRDEEVSVLNYLLKYIKADNVEKFDIGFYINLGVNINIVDPENGYTPLMYFVKILSNIIKTGEYYKDEQYESILNNIKIMIDNNAEIDIKNKRGQTVINLLNKIYNSNEYVLKIKELFGINVENERKELLDKENEFKIPNYKIDINSKMIFLYLKKEINNKKYFEKIKSLTFDYSGDKLINFSDKHLYPDYLILPIYKETALHHFPEIKSILNETKYNEHFIYNKKDKEIICVKENLITKRNTPNYNYGNKKGIFYLLLRNGDKILIKYCNITNPLKEDIGNIDDIYNYKIELFYKKKPIYLKQFYKNFFVTNTKSLYIFENCKGYEAFISEGMLKKLKEKNQLQIIKNRYAKDLYYLELTIDRGYSAGHHLYFDKNINYFVVDLKSNLAVYYASRNYDIST